MTQDEIIEMARQAGISKDHAEGMTLFLEAFAKLVDAKATAKEREACALICDSHADDPVYCGEAIRARGEV